MTAEPDLLPLPEPGMLHVGEPSEWFTADQMQTYARACVAHATAPLQAEIEAMREEVDVLRGKVDEAVVELLCRKARADRLAEALRDVLIDLERSQANMRNAAKTDPRWEGCADAIQPRVDTARALLRDQENNDA